MRQLPAHYRVLTQEPDRPLADEGLLTDAVDEPVALLWQAPQSLVVPRTYAARTGFTQAQICFETNGWPIYVRQSGGGVVPQGPGILNLGLAQRFQGRPLDHAETLYQHLCKILQTVFNSFGLATHTQAVEGSFCDGRYNLAMSSPARKVVGTAQVWRRAPGHTSDTQIGLAHALILAQCNPEGITTQANWLEAALGSERRYEPHKITSLDQELPRAQRATFTDELTLRLYTTLVNQAALPEGE